MENTIPGNDRGTLSAKVLGSDSRVAMWRAHSQVGLVVVPVPPVPKIDHEVPWLEPEHSDDEEVA